MQAIEVAQMVDEALDANNIELVLRCINLAESQVFSKCLKAVEPTTSDTAISFRRCFSASWVYSKIISLGVSFLERERRYMFCRIHVTVYCMFSSLFFNHRFCPTVFAKDNIVDKYYSLGITLDSRFCELL